jgi:hypothetical protein
MLVKAYLHPTAVKYLMENVTEFHISPYNNSKNPEYYVTLKNGDKYLLDVYEETRELISVTSMEQLDDIGLGSMEDELATMGEYVELCAEIERRLLELAKLHKLSNTKSEVLDASVGTQSQLSPDRLLDFINDLNTNYVKNFLK